MRRVVRIPGRRSRWAIMGRYFFAWVAEGCSRVSGQELAEAAERLHADIARKAREKELEAWGQLKVFSPPKMGAQSEDIVDARWALTWKEVEGMITVEARFVAKGYQDPGLRNVDVDIAGCVSRLLSHCS